jgi:CheY-like chemotaxis protein
LAPLRATPQRVGPPTVLVADDSKVVRIKTSRLLEKQGWRVLLADDGQAALVCLETETPDLLITDVEMPGLDGFELTRLLRGSVRWARLPVIMITSSDDKHRAEAINAGVNVLLGKPYSEETLLAQAMHLLGSAAWQDTPALH